MQALQNALHSFSRLAAALPGRFSGPVKALLAVMALSYLCGVAAALFGKGYEAPGKALGPRALLTPLSRRAVELAVVALCALLDAQLGTDALLAAASLFYLAVEAISLLKSAALLSVPIPEKLRGVLNALRKRKDSQED